MGVENQFTLDKIIQSSFLKLIGVQRKNMISHLCNNLETWAICLTSLSLNFLVCKMEIIMSPVALDCSMGQVR